MSTVDQSAAFIAAMFDPDDCITFRPIETWSENDKKQSRVLYKEVRRVPAKRVNTDMLTHYFHALEHERANCFFGVCPRREPDSDKHQHELAWQIPTVRCLWVDVDHCTVDEALQRISEAGLPEPSIVVASGNGAHVYWLLKTPIDTQADARPVLTEWLDIKGKRKPVPYIMDGDDRVWLRDPTTNRRISHSQPKLTPVAQHVQDVIQGMASKFGGDSTQDVTRLLALPGSMNRKNERNGDEPKPRRIVTLEAERKYDFSEFEKYAEESPGKIKREKADKVTLPAVKRMTPTRRDKLSRKLAACEAATDRSTADFSLCCHAIEQGVDQAEVWEQCQFVGKFEERGEDYFLQTWEAAARVTREKIYEQAERETGDSPEAVSPADGVTEIEMGLDEQVTNDAAIEALVTQSDVFDFHGELAVVQAAFDGEQSKLAVRRIPLPTVREHVASSARFYRLKETDGNVEKQFFPVPQRTIEAIASRGIWDGMRQLKRVVYSPTLRPDGTVLQVNGYDEASGLYLDCSQDIPKIPHQPTPGDVKASVSRLVDLVADFPFAADEHKSAFLAALLTPFARETYSGATAPLIVIDATTPGSGKTLLADLIAMIAVGHTAPKQAAPSQDDEFRKMITAKAITANPIELIDNIAGRFGCPSLDAALTSTIWNDRELGRNRTVSLPLRMLWLATGNNIQLRGDLHRRICHIRLEPDTAAPERREGFRHPNLLAHVHAHRMDYVSDCLTILRGYIAAGKPDQRLQPWGSFEGWSEVVRGAIAWAGLLDCELTRKEVDEDNDEASRASVLLAAIEAIGGDGLRARDMINIARQQHYDVPGDHSRYMREAIEDFCQQPLDRLDSRLGYRLRAIKGRVFDGRRLDSKKCRGHMQWFVETAKSPTPTHHTEAGGITNGT